MHRILIAPWAAAAVACLSFTAHAADLDLRLIGTQEIKTGTGFPGIGIEFGGISGIDRLANGSYVALSDERGTDKGTPRFYNLSLNYNASGFTGVTVNSQTFMLRPDGTPFPTGSRTLDPEGIRTLANGNLIFSSEGNFSTTQSALYQPFVREMKADGTFVREFSMPSMFNYVDGTTTGARNNKLFEALAVTPNGTIFTANEDALVQDGNITTLTSGSVIRVTAIDPVSGAASKQYAYQLPNIPVDSIAAAPGAPYVTPDNGLPELLAINDTSLIAMERAFAAGVGNTIRLVKTTITANTTDVSGIDSLIGASYIPMTREVLLEMPLTYEGVTLDNMEGMSWGPTLANGNRSLVLVSDNNFSGSQRTLFMAFEVAPVPEPETWAMMLAGLATVAAMRRRKKR